VGIVSYGLYLPAAVESAEALAGRSALSIEQWHALGVRQKYRPSKEDQPVTMAARAAEQAFAAAGGVTPREVDVLIYTGEEYKDYIAQTASIRLQEELGCGNAYAFDLVGQGVSTIVGLRVAHDMICGDPSIRTVLLAGGTRNVDLVDYSRPETRFLFSYSASGSALVVKKDHAENRLVATAFHTDPEMADAVCVPGGGTEHPFSAGNLDSELMFYGVADPEKLEVYLRDIWPTRLEQTMKAARADADIEYLALRHLPPDQRERILGAFGLPAARSASLADFGHHGANDVVISLDLGIKNGAVRDGMTIGMLSGGNGFTYAAATIQWG
jgi:3-oxoacyl-[acyl-carrier-protein] synthase-3